jgi:hypothetical protein
MDRLDIDRDASAWTASRTHARRISLLALVVIVLGAAAGEAASLTATWDAPTTNVDGTSLKDLASYRIYLGTAEPTCPGTSYHAVPSATSAPPPAQTVSSRISALTAGVTYIVRVTAVDTAGNESPCSSSASGIAHSDFSVAPSTLTSFGTVAVGSSVDRIFTVQNTSSISIAGTASVAAPFWIIAGGSFSLSPGATQAVTVRFQPTTADSFASNISFTSNGDTLSRAVSGSTPRVKHSKPMR